MDVDNTIKNTIQIKCEAATTLPLDSLLEFQGGLKKLTKANREKLMTSIINNGFIAPIFVWCNDGKFMLLDGHQRLSTLNYMRENDWIIPDLPVAFVEADNEQDARKKLLHITSSYGEFDEVELDKWLADFDSDMEDSLRLVNSEIEIKMPDEETDGDDDIPEEIKPVTKLGDIWELNGHRVMCGDSTNSGAIELLMNGQRAGMCFTDPPYNIDYEGGSKKREKIKNDKLSDFYSFLLRLYTNIKTSLKDGSPIYVTHADSERVDFTKAFMDAGFKLSSVLIWVKNNSTFTMGKNYYWKHEAILYGWKTGSCHKWYGGTKQDTIWNFDRPSKSAEHPTMKPIELIIKTLKNSSIEKDIIIDFCLGSGSTLIASEKLNRVCYGMELDPHYCDVISNRYKKWMTENNRDFTIKLNGKVYHG